MADNNTFDMAVPLNSTKMEKGLFHVAKRLLTIEVPLRDLWSPSKCPAPLLPYLAASLSVDFWDDRWSEERKRAVIAASPIIHRRKGTRGAMERAIEALGYDLSVQEWFDYGGDPYHFKLILGNGTAYSALSEQDWESVIATALRAKNVRSVLEGISAKVVFQSECPHVACGIATRALSQISPLSIDRLTSHDTLKSAMGIYTHHHILIAPLGQ